MTKLALRSARTQRQWAADRKLCSRALEIRRSAGKTIPARLFQRPARHGGKLAGDAVGELPGDRQLALALEPLDGGLGIGIDDAGRLDLTIAILGERPLQREHALR